MIKGISDQRRMPRLGKIKLGVMVQEPGRKPYPRATDYFVCPAEVQKVFGERPTSLDVMFPASESRVIFPQEYKCYRSAGLWCAGNGEHARRWDDAGDLKEIPCPCPLLESEECGPVATLNFLLADVAGVGIWQLTTGNVRSITGLNTSLEMFSRMFGGLAGIPFRLVLEPQQIQRHDERLGKMVRQTIQVLRLDSPYTIRQIVEWQTKMGRPAEALMPAPDIDEADRAALPAGQEDEPADTPPQGEGVGETTGLGGEPRPVAPPPAAATQSPAPQAAPEAASQPAPPAKVAPPGLFTDDCRDHLLRLLKAARATLMVTDRAYRTFVEGKHGGDWAAALAAERAALEGAAGSQAAADAYRKHVLDEVHKALRARTGNRS